MVIDHLCEDKMIDLSKTMNYGQNPQYAHTMGPEDLAMNPVQGTNTGPIADPNATPPPAQGQSGQNWDYDPYQDFQMDAPPPFPFPEQWKTASDYFTNLTQSGVPTPWQYGYGSEQLRNMIDAQGMPVDIQGYADAQLPVYQTMMEDMTKQSQESAGLSGTRWSSSLGNQIAEQGRRLTENYGADVANKWMQAQEAARGRMMGGMGMMLPYGQASANLGLQNTQNQMYGANALRGLGSDYLYGPMNIATGMANLGQGIYGQQQGGINQQMNDPWLQAALGLGNQQSQQYTPMYNPSWLTQGLGAASSMAPYIFNNQGQNYGNPGITGEANAYP